MLTGLALCLGVLAPPTITPTELGWSVQAAGYTATVGRDGCFTGLRVGEAEFLDCGPAFPRGAYFYQGGLLPLPQVTVGDQQLTAQSDKARAVYHFEPQRVRWTLTNLTKERLLLVAVFRPELLALQDDLGRWLRAPKERAWTVGTAYLGAARLTLRGSTRWWGPWGRNQQIWETALGPEETREVILEPAVATSAEQAQAAAVAAAPDPVPTEPTGPMWDLAAHGAVPQTWPAEGFEAPGVRAVFYEGPPYAGRPTRVFAWIGLPEVPAGTKVPGIVLVHGGGGTAFETWVRLWTARGYAAIAMDTCGCVPRGKYSAWQRHAAGGPPGWGGFGQIDEPREDQWTYHAVASALRAHSLLRSLPEVDADRIGLTGISWGGYLASILAGVDTRLKFVVPVYGCGFTLDMPFGASVRGLGAGKSERWMRWWDPSVYLPQAKMPVCWVTGTNDFAYTVPGLTKSFHAVSGPRSLAIRLRMPHGHGAAGEAPEEIRILADSVVKGADPLPQVLAQGRDGVQAWCRFRAAQPLAKATLLYTTASGQWPERLWEEVPATVSGDRVTATLPAGVTCWFLNLYDPRNVVASSEPLEIAAP
ncbi:MAG: acetylxylan esterase [Fimbriimonadaceae bacterium]|nr:acetylxylan esterase [Fimbriimonadaceae bacterium]